MKLQQIEIDELKRIVNDTFLVDLDANNRKRNTVDARKIYSKILRDGGRSFEEISKSINKNHATVIHYVYSLEHILIYDKDLRDKYVACKNIYKGVRKTISTEIKKDIDVYVTIVRLTNELQEAIWDKKKVISNFIDFLEEYEELNGYLPSIKNLKNNILPLFNDK